MLRNVAELVSTPKGIGGSKAMTFEQATAMLEEAMHSRMHAYATVSLLTGIRTEEARARPSWRDARNGDPASCTASRVRS